jgi:hypothetical protein
MYEGHDNRRDHCRSAFKWRLDECENLTHPRGDDLKGRRGHAAGATKIEHVANMGEQTVWRWSIM